MSKRIVYRRKNSQNMPVAERADVVPNAAPAVAKSDKLSKKKKLACILLIFVAVIAIALLVLTIIVHNYATKFSQTPPTISIKTSIANMDVYENEDLKSSENYKNTVTDILLNYAEASHSLKENEDILNFALYGVSDITGDASFITLVSVNTEKNVITYSVFEDNILVYIPMVSEERGVGKLQDAYAWGGTALLTKTIEHNFGVKIDGFVELKMATFEAVINNVGGINVNIKDKDVFNAAVQEYNSRFAGSASFIDKAGTVNLDGAQSIAYLRMPGSNTAGFITAVGSSIFGGGLGSMIDAFKLLSADAQEDSYITKDDFFDLLFSAFSLGNATSQTVSVGTSTKEMIWHRSFAVFGCDYTYERTTLQKVIYG